MDDNQLGEGRRGTRKKRTSVCKAPESDSDDIESRCCRMRMSRVTPASTSESGSSSSDTAAEQLLLPSSLAFGHPLFA